MLSFNEKLKGIKTAPTDFNIAQRLEESMNRTSKRIAVIFGVLDVLQRSNLGFSEMFADFQEVLRTELFFDQIVIKRYPKMMKSIRDSELGKSILEERKRDNLTYKSVLTLFAQNFSTLVSDNLELISNLEEKNSSKTNILILDLNKKIASLQQELETHELNILYSNAQKKIVELNQQIDQKDKRMTELANLLTLKNSDIKRLSEKVEDTQTKVIHMRRDIEEKDDLITKLQYQIGGADETGKDLKEILNMQEKRIKEYDKIFQQIITKMQFVRKEMAELEEENLELREIKERVDETQQIGAYLLTERPNFRDEAKKAKIKPIFCNKLA